MTEYDKIHIEYDVAYKLDSSFLDFFLYNLRTATILVAKKGGNYYAYNNVTESQVESFIMATSPGRYFMQGDLGKHVAHSIKLFAVRRGSDIDYIETAINYSAFSDPIESMHIDTVEMTDNVYTLVGLWTSNDYVFHDGELESLY
jgi:hypothetical protein